MNRADGFAEQMQRLTCLSDGLFGEAAEMDSFEAEALLRAAGMDPDGLKSRLYQRLDQQAQTHGRRGKPLPRVYMQALDDLRPLTLPARKEAEILGQAKAAVNRVIERAKSLSKLLEGQSAPTFTMAYRNKKKLSPRDKQLLDSVTEEQRKRVEKFRGD
jgi:hypothetical protein